jgi:hypothetical protein
MSFDVTLLTSPLQGGLGPACEAVTRCWIIVCIESALQGVAGVDELRLIASALSRLD